MGTECPLRAAIACRILSVERSGVPGDQPLRSGTGEVAQRSE
jgi:hypothetical protein